MPGDTIVVDVFHRADGANVTIRLVQATGYAQAEILENGDDCDSIGLLCCYTNLEESERVDGDPVRIQSFEERCFFLNRQPTMHSKAYGNMSMARLDCAATSVLAIDNVVLAVAAQRYVPKSE